MKFIHIADLHIGKRVNDFSMIEDQKYILEQITDVAAEEGVDGVLIAGDVYDKSVPPAEAVGLLNSFVTRLVDMGLKVFMISGNHDSAERLSFAGDLLDNCGMYISPVFDGNVKKITMNDDYGELNVYMLPFVKPLNVKLAYDIEQSMSYTEAVKYVLDNMDIDTNCRNIIVAHQFVTGAVKCDSEEISVGGIDNVDANVFEKFDYVALGHIHNPQTVLRDTVRYCGTPLKYSFSECRHQKSITIVELGAKGDVTINFRPLVPLHDMMEIKGTFEQITDSDYYKNLTLDDYYHITLTDEEDIIDVVGKLRSIYPNVMRIDYDNTRTRTSNVINADTDSETKTPNQLFGDLYALQNNAAMTEEQQQYINKLIDEIWGD